MICISMQLLHWELVITNEIQRAMDYTFILLSSHHIIAMLLSCIPTYIKQKICNNYHYCDCQETCSTCCLKVQGGVTVALNF